MSPAINKYVWRIVRKYFGRPPLDKEDYVRAGLILGLKDLALETSPVREGLYIATDTRTVQVDNVHYMVTRGDTLRVRGA